MTTLDAPIEGGFGFESDRGGGAKPQGTKPLAVPGGQGIADRLSSLRAKLVVPYVLLTLAVAMIGMFIITRLVASTLRERFANQLLEASRVAADSIVRRERVHLENLRLMAFTQGVASAIGTLDAAAVQSSFERLVRPFAIATGVTVPVASIEDLITMKSGTGRAKDASDIAALRALRTQEGSDK